MSSVLMFAANWDKWYRVLRYHNGFGVLDSTRFGLWLACGSKGSHAGRHPINDTSTLEKGKDYELSKYGIR